jgi:ankyrin repeat protein
MEEDPMMSLHDALQWGASPEVIEAMVRQRPRLVLEPDQHGALPIHTAVRVGAPIRVLVCLLRPFSKAPFERDDSGCNALHFISPMSSLASVQYLVGQWPGLLRGTNHHGELPLHSAAEAGASVDMLRFLAEQDPPALNEYDNAGYLPVQRLFGPDACPVRVRLLVELDRNFNVRTHHPQQGGGLTLHCAVRHKCPWRVIRYFVRMWPASVQVEDQDGRCPLFRHFDVVDGDELDYGSYQVLLYLTRKWRDSVFQRDNDDNTVLHHAVRSRATLAALELLVLMWPNSVWATNNHGCLPLHGAINQEDPALEMLELLVGEAPESVFETDNLGRFPIQIAIDRGFPRLITRLLTGQPPPARVEDDSD